METKILNLESKLNKTSLKNQKTNNSQYKVSDQDLDKIIQITRNGFGTNMKKDDIIAHVCNVDDLYLIKNNEDLIGFASYDNLNYHNNNILYLSGIVIEPEFQKHGLFGLINKEAIKNNNPDFITMRTQNPAVYSGANKLSSEIYPNDSGFIPDNIKEIGTHIATNHLGMQTFNKDQFLERGTYSKALTKEIPLTKSNPFFDNTLNIDYTNGDSVLIIAKPKSDLYRGELQ